MIFSEIFKVLEFFNIIFFEDFNRVIGICEGTLMGLQFLPLIMSAQNLAVFEI